MDKILKAMQTHHDYVKQNYNIVMTILCGSQNYKLDTKHSDYDTYSFVLPTKTDIAFLKEPVSTLTEDAFGHINIKDIRLALNLLKKTSPNSIEWFATPYKIIEPEFDWINELCSHPEIFRCDTKHMMNAIGGMSHQLTKRNMPPGKGYSHLLRMSCMVDNYYRRRYILGLTPDLRKLALEAKQDPENKKYNLLCEDVNKDVQEKIKAYQVDMFLVECTGIDIVNRAQKKIMEHVFRS